MKNKRQIEILNIISKDEIQTQEQLMEALVGQGFQVTQATVSRDIKELGLVKISGEDNTYKYALPMQSKLENDKHIAMFSDAVMGVDCAWHTIVMKTFPGMAPAIASYLDTSMNLYFLGCVAGDDTIIIVTKSPQKAEELTVKLNQLFRLNK